uniref:DUF4005 domain-containing protein n=1 Tax=Panagrellus redivivus TaxID=6233 RepID=A0A7E4ZVX8_PANRE
MQIIMDDAVKMDYKHHPVTVLTLVIINPSAHRQIWRRGHTSSTRSKVARQCQPYLSCSASSQPGKLSSMEPLESAFAEDSVGYRHSSENAFNNY